MTTAAGLAGAAGALMGIDVSLFLDRAIEIANGIRGEGRRALVCDPDLRQVGPGGGNEVILEASATPVVHDVDAGVQTAVLHAGELWNVANPLVFVAPTEVVTLPG
jgi:hypothetical protein